MADFYIPGQTIGIIGGNQIARFLAFAAKSMGYRVGILAPSLDCVAADLADWQIQAESTDLSSVLKLAENSDLLTFSDEYFDIDVLKHVADSAAIPQTYPFLKICQNRLLEREFLEDSNMNIVPYGRVNELEDIHRLIEGIGFPSILKVAAPKAGGVHQQRIKNLTDLADCLPLLMAGPCLLEAEIPFQKEIIVSIVGNGSGETSVYPLMETIYNRAKEAQGYRVANDLPAEVEAEVVRIAELVALSFNLQGLCSIELLLAENGILYVNSLNLGPHKSGYGTIEMTNLSQFEAHIRGICGWPIPKIKQHAQGFVFPVTNDQLVEALGQIPFQNNWYHHYYSKSMHKSLGVVGHITMIATDLAAEFNKIKEVNIWKL